MNHTQEDGDKETTNNKEEDKENKEDKKDIKVSIVITVKNSEEWLDECLESVMAQSHRPLEVVVFEDCSQDKSVEILKRWGEKFEQNKIEFKLMQNNGTTSRGCGYGKNRGVENSSADYICMLDSDDFMHKDRVALQLEACIKNQNCIIGSNFERTPSGSTARYTQWCNSLSLSQLIFHQFRECTLIHPTWFMHKSLFYKVGGYDESGPGTPEDTRKEDYSKSTFLSYHPSAMSKQIHRLDLVQIRMDAFERRVLVNWPSFTIWSAGRDGKKFFNMLKDENKKKVAAFCDIDQKKIGTNCHICVALDRTNGEFEKNVHSLGLVEGVDYWHFC